MKAIFRFSKYYSSVPADDVTASYFFTAMAAVKCSLQKLNCACTRAKVTENRNVQIYRKHERQQEGYRETCPPL